MKLLLWRKEPRGSNQTEDWLLSTVGAAKAITYQVSVHLADRFSKILRT